jgi:hypothetical protein
MSFPSPSHQHSVLNLVLVCGCSLYQLIGNSSKSSSAGFKSSSTCYYVTQEKNSELHFKQLTAGERHDIACYILCGKGRVRTQNLGISSPVLCQLSYKPCTTSIIRRCLHRNSYSNVCKATVEHAVLLANISFPVNENSRIIIICNGLPS